MGRISDASMNALLDLLLGSGHAGFMPSSVDIALSTTPPTNTGGNVTEPTGPSYARVQVTNDDSHWPAASARQKSNGTTITFPQPTGPWGGDIGWIAIYDHGVTGPTGYRAGVELQTHRAVDASSAPPAFGVGAIVINGPGG